MGCIHGTFRQLLPTGSESQSDGRCYGYQRHLAYCRQWVRRSDRADVGDGRNLLRRRGFGSYGARRNPTYQGASDPPPTSHIQADMAHHDTPRVDAYSRYHSTQSLHILGDYLWLYPGPRSNLGASKLALGIIGVAALVPYTLTAPMNHHFAARLGENRTVFTGILVMAVTMFLVPLIHNIPLLTVAQGASGFGRGLVYPLLMGLSIREISGEDRATAMGVFQAIYAIGMFLGPATAGAVADVAGLSGAFIIAGAVSVVAAVAGLTLIGRTNQPSRSG